MKNSPIAPDGGNYEIKEPRDCSDFQPEHYPTTNGKPAPLTKPESRNDRIMVEFAALYYDLNRLYVDLLGARELTDAAQRKATERRVLQAIERVLIHRDELEDSYAPMGVIADPVAESGFVRDIRFGFGDVDGAGQRRSETFTITTYFPVPLPDDMRLDELPVKVEGPGLYSDPADDDAQADSDQLPVTR